METGGTRALKGVIWFLCSVLCLVSIGWLLMAGYTVTFVCLADTETAEQAKTERGAQAGEGTTDGTATGGGTKDGTATGDPDRGVRNVRGAVDESTLLLENVDNLITLVDGVLKGKGDGDTPCITKACRQAETELERLIKRMKRLTKPADKICNTESCHQAADWIKKQWNPEADPCDDFYEFACGGLLKQELPDKKVASIGTIPHYIDVFNNRSRGLLEEEIRKDEPEAYKKKKTHYKACMDTATIDAQGFQPIKDFFQNNNLTPPYRKSDDFLGEVVRYTNLGITSLFGFSVYAIQGTPHIRMYSKLDDIDIPSLLNDTRLLLPSLGYVATLEIDTRIEELGHALKNTTKTPWRKHGPPEHTTKTPWSIHDPRIPLRNLTDKFTERFRLKWLINTVLDSAGVDLTLKGRDNVVVQCPSYLTHYAKVLTNTTDQVLLTTLALNAINDLREFTSLRKNATNETARWDMCKKGMGYARGRMYGDRYFKNDPNIKQTLHDLTRMLGLQAQLLFAHTTWMDEPTKVIAIKKTSLMTYDHVYPDWSLNNTALDFFYRTITVKEDTAMANHLSVKHAEFVNKMEKIFRDDLFLWWDDEVMWINAVYSGLRNQLRINLGLLMPPTYRRDAIRALNFGGIGSIAAHEIIHGFDTSGHNVDEKGAMRDWWSNTSREAFVEGTQCIIDQYSNYTIPVTNITEKGEKTVNDNIADIGGVKVAYLAYRNWVEYEGDEEPMLPGLDITPSQIFFMNFASFWCAKYSYVATKKLFGRAHSAHRNRVIGSLTGFKGFADAYNCPRGSRMNPGPQCPLY